MSTRASSPLRVAFHGVLCLLGCVGMAVGATVPERVWHGHVSRVRGFDPVRAGDVSSALAVGKIYEGLFQYAYTARPYRLEPNLALDFPEVSPDGRVYTFHLRPGVMFQPDPCFNPDRLIGSGAMTGVPADESAEGPANANPGTRPPVPRELVAADLVYAIKRVADLKTESTGYWAFRDRIVGLDRFREASALDTPTDYDQPVAGLQAPDRYTLQVTLTGPYPQFLWILAMPYAYAVPREAVEFYGDGFAAHPVGTGPFKLAFWRRNYRLEFIRHSAWQPHPAAGVDLAEAFRFMPDRIVEHVIGDSSTQWLAFLSGELDVFKEISRDNWDAVIDRDGGLSETLRHRGIRLHSISGLNVFYIGFNMDDPVVGHNRALRQALTCAFNTEQWVRFHNGRVTRAQGPIPPGVSGHEDGPGPFSFDLEKARRLLVEAGYPEGRDPATGRRLVLNLELGLTDTDFRESTELFIDFMDKIGVVIRPCYNNKPTFFEKVERRQAQMFRLSWFADYPDAENFLQLFYGPNASPGSNRSNYVNPGYDALYERARTMQDSDERTDLYRAMARQVIEDCPWIFMHHPVDYSLSQPWVENFFPHDFPYGMEKYYRLNADRRARPDWRD